MSKTLTREEVIDLLKPHKGEGDRKLHDAFIRQTKTGERSLNRREAKLIAWAARDRNRITRREGRCIMHIANYNAIDGDAIRYLINFLWLSEAYKRTSHFTPIPPWIEDQNIQLLQTASKIPVQFILPDKRHYVYQFKSLSTVAHLLRTGFINQFYYNELIPRGRGFYQPYADCLAFNGSAALKEHERSSNVVHEAIHAVQDLHHWNSDTGHKEAAAHIAQAVWLVRHRKPLTARLAEPAIRDLAEQMCKQVAKKGLRLFMIDDDVYKDVRKVLETDYIISSTPAKSNGTNFSFRRELFDRKLFFRS